MANFNTSIGVQNQTKAGLNSAMNDIMSWFAKASKYTVLDVQAKLNNPNFNKLVSEWEAAAKKAHSKLKKFSFEGIFSSPAGKSMREVKIEFDKNALQKLNQSDALNYLGQLKELQNRLNKGLAVSNGTFDKKERTQLYELISLLEQATDKYRNMMREEDKFTRRSNKPPKVNNVDDAKEQNRRAMAAANNLARQKKHADALAASTNKLTQQEERYNAAKSRNSNTTKGVQEEINELRKLIRLKEQNLRLQQLRKNITEDSQLRGYRDRLRTLEQQNRTLGIQEGLFRRLIGYAARYFSLQQVVQFARKVAETTGYFEQQRVALEGITQSAEKATILFNQLKGLAVKSPFQFKDLVGFSKQLSAFQIPTDELFDTTKRLADISAGLGVDMSRIILAFGQVRSASVLRGQELRQFTEAGIPLVDELAKRFTLLEGRMVSTAEVFERISNRGVSFEMVRDILFDMTEEGGRFYEMQEKISETTYGQMQKLQDYKTIAMSEIGNASSGIINGVIKALQQMVIHWRTTIWTIAGLLGTVLIGALHKVKLKAIEAGTSFRRVFTGFLKANWLSMALSALSVIIGVIIGKLMDTRAELNRLKNELNEIGEQYDKKGVGLVNNFRKLTEALQETTRGSEAERKAYEKLLATYSEYLPQQDLEIEHLRQLKDGYDEVNKAILAQVEAKKIAAQKEKVMEELSSGIENAFFAENKSSVFNSWGYTGENAKNDKYGIFREFKYDGGTGTIVSSLLDKLSKNAQQYMMSSIQDYMTNNALEDISDSDYKEGIKDILKLYFGEKVDDSKLTELVNRIAENTLKIRQENAALLGIGNQDYKIYEELRNRGYSDEDITRYGLIAKHTKLNNLDKQLATALRNVYNEEGSAGKPEVVERNQDALQFEYALKKADLFGLSYDKEAAKSFAADIRAGNKDRDEIIDYLAQIYGVESEKKEEITKGKIDKDNYDNRYGTLESFKTNKNKVTAPVSGSVIDKQLEKTFFEATVPILDRIRAISGFEKTDWTSSYRPIEYNKKKSSTGNRSRHIYGEAFDLWLDGNRENAERIIKEVYKELHGEFDQILLEYHSNNNKYGVHVGVATNERNRKQILEVDANKGFTAIDDQSRMETLKTEAEAEMAAEAAAQLEAQKQQTQTTEQSTEDITAYQKAEKNMREEILKSIERQMIAYREYEKDVNKYLIDVRDNQTQLAETKKTVNSLLKMSPASDYKAYTKKLQDEYDNATGFIAKQIVKDPAQISDPVLKKQLQNNIEIKAIVEHIAELVNYDLNNAKKTTSEDRSYKAFANLFKLVREGRKELNKIAEIKGYGVALADFVNLLDDDNLLKRFMTFENPLGDYIAELAEVGIDVTGLENLSNETIKEGGIAPDFMAMWDKLTNAIKLQIMKSQIENAGGTKDAVIAKWQELYNQFTAERQTIFSQDDTQNKLNQVLKELEAIKSNTNKQIQLFANYNNLKGDLGWEDAYRFIYGKDKADINFQEKESNIYLDQLKQFLQHEAGGVTTLFNGESGSSILNAGNLNIQHLNALIDMINELETSDDTPDNMSVEAYKKLKTEVKSIIDNLIKAIVEETKSLYSTLHSEDKLTRALQNHLKAFKDNTANLKKANEDKTISDKEYENANLSEVQNLYDNIAKSLGGTGNEKWAEQLFGDTESEKGISKFGDFLQKGLGMLNGNGPGLEQTIGNQMGQQVAAGQMSAGEAAGAMQGVSGGIAIADAIIKGIYKAIKAIGELTDSIIEVNESGMNVNGKVTENGGLNSESWYKEKNKNQRIKAGMNIVQNYNQHVMDGWESVKSGDGLGALVHVITSITDFVRDINKYLHLEDTQRIEELGREIEELGLKMERLDFEASMSSSMDKMSKETEKAQALFEQSTKYQEQFEIENSMKGGDAEAAAEYLQKSTEAYREAVNLVKEMREEIVGTAYDLASNLGDALAEAFQNGTNAARAWRNAVKEYIGSVLREMLLIRVIEPQLKVAMDKLMGGTEEQIAQKVQSGEIKDYGKYVNERLSDKEKVKEFERTLTEVGDREIDAIAKLDPELRDLMFYKGSNASLSGGIESITEDTARRVEALSNSQLAETIVVRQCMESIVAMSKNRYVLTSSMLSSINSQVQAINQNTAGLYDAIESIRNDVRPLYVKISQ